jgi:hypothetical protein
VTWNKDENNVNMKGCPPLTDIFEKAEHDVKTVRSDPIFIADEIIYL